MRGIYDVVKFLRTNKYLFKNKGYWWVQATINFANALFSRFP